MYLHHGHTSVSGKRKYVLPAVCAALLALVFAACEVTDNEFRHGVLPSGGADDAPISDEVARRLDTAVAESTRSAPKTAYTIPSGETRESIIVSAPIVFVLAFNMNEGGEGTILTIKTVTAPAETVDSLPASPTRAGYAFIGWNTAPDGTGASFDENTTVNANMSVYAVWTAIPVFEEETPSDDRVRPLSVGLGLELNMNARKNFAAGLSLGADYALFAALQSFAAGIHIIGSSNFAESFSFEIAALFRWYFQNLFSGSSGAAEHSGFFAQVDLGLYVFFAEDTWFMFNGGLRGGYRFDLGNFYVEPYGRAGYPYAWGIGVMTGIKL